MEIDFKLSENFIERYKRKKPPWGFNGLGELVYMSKYSRLKDNGDNERWWETVRRVVEGTYKMQRKHIERYELGWNAWRAQKSAQEMYDRIWNMKFLPPGRGLWAMGSSITEKKGLYAALNNCAFISTNKLKEDSTKPFCFLMDASMLGIGVGFDTRGAESIIVKGPNSDVESWCYSIPDNREGWVESLKLLLKSYFSEDPIITFDYSSIREKGSPIKGFGGTSSGYEPLENMHKDIRKVLDKNAGCDISITTIVDIMNLVGKCVVSGNLRRTAEIVFGDPTSDEYLNLKNYKINKDREAFGWTSNNSVFADIGMDYSAICKRIKDNGEPGLIWLDNIRHYGRLFDQRNGKDLRVMGANPCSEQSLESAEVCCLVETFPYKHEDLDDFLKTLKYAYLYAKTVTLSKTHWPETNRVMLRNRRIGCSVSGLAQFITYRGLDTLQQWLMTGYDELKKWDTTYSEWFAVPRSIKLSSVKPSGTTSLLVGATPGVHYPESEYYIRRLRLSVNSKLLKPLEEAGYKIEPAIGSEETTVIVEVPVHIGDGLKTAKELSIWEQMSLAAFMQKYWADNQVSCTITFDPEKEGHCIETALDYFQYQLKGISFLPRKKGGSYKQMPYEEIDKKTFDEMRSKLKKLTFGKIRGEEVDPDRFCNTDYCEIKQTNQLAKRDENV